MQEKSRARIEPHQGVLLKNLGNWLNLLANRFMPDPFVFALLMTLGCFLFALLSNNSIAEIGKAWNSGFFSLLAFAMQMSLILLLGHTLASVPLVHAFLNWLADRPNSASSALCITALVAMITGLLNWGFSIIAGAMTARFIGESCQRRHIAVHYPLLGASGYLGLAVWHGGLSGSAPLTVASSDHSLFSKIGTIALEHTIFSDLNIWINLGQLIWIPLLICLIHPQKPLSMSDLNIAPLKHPTPDLCSQTPASRLEHSRLLLVLPGLLGLYYLLNLYFSGSLTLDLNLVIFILATLNLLLHQKAKSLIQAVSQGTQSTGGILLQFPFYGGIMGIMKDCGLVALLSKISISLTTAKTYPLFVFFTACLINLFVPSGGAQWAVQGPIAIDACLNMGADPAKVVLALSYGDQWTNLLQPFWALALLGITGLKASQIAGYCILILCAGLIFYPLMLLLPV